MNSRFWSFSKPKVALVGKLPEIINSILIFSYQLVTHFLTKKQVAEKIIWLLIYRLDKRWWVALSYLQIRLGQTDPWGSLAFQLHELKKNLEFVVLFLLSLDRDMLGSVLAHNVMLPKPPCPGDFTFSAATDTERQLQDVGGSLV